MESESNCELLFFVKLKKTNKQTNKQKKTDVLCPNHGLSGPYLWYEKFSVKTPVVLIYEMFIFLQKEQKMKAVCKMCK